MPDEVHQQLAVDVLDHADQIKLPATTSGVATGAALARASEVLALDVEDLDLGCKRAAIRGKG